MRFERLVSWGGAKYRTRLEAPDPERVRISPRSFRAGEHCGFVCGLGAGIVLGFIASMLVWITKVGGE